MKVVGYVRVSRDEDKENYSSIINQKKIINNYALERNWTIDKYYEDDNVSGYTFDRPAFNCLVSDMNNNLVDIVIAKDLSRIGRHNAYTLLFIDNTKKNNKRLILPNESGGFDTDKDENDLLGIYTWFNEMYIRDISRKTISSIKAKQKDGQMIIKEHFGYCKSTVDKHILLIEPKTASVVKKIYELYQDGNGYRKIAQQLNNLCIPTPSLTIKMRKEECGCIYEGSVSNTWSPVQIQRILKNDIYIGTLRLGKTKKTMIKGKSVYVDKNNQYVFEDNHEAVISKKDFYSVQKLINKRNTTNFRNQRINNNIFSGLLFCEECGSYMIAYNKKDREKVYICGNYHKKGVSSCKRHSIKEKELITIYKNIILKIISKKSEFENVVDISKIVNKQHNFMLLNTLRQSLDKAKKELKASISQKIKYIAKSNYIENVSVIEETYFELEKDKEREIEGLRNQIKHMENDINATHNDSKYGILGILDKIYNQETPSKRDVNTLIEKITINNENIIKVFLKCQI